MRLALILALVLAGCAAAPPASSPMPTGQAVPAPAGWVGYCARNPQDPAC